MRNKTIQTGLDRLCTNDVQEIGFQGNFLAYNQKGEKEYWKSEGKIDNARS